MTQKDALDILKLGHNVFLTGAPGSGKTYLLNKYIDYLHAHKVPVGITASTGIAATHMGGMTIHSFTGMGIKDAMDEGEIKELFRRKYLRDRFIRTKVLIIDEVSMMHAHSLDLVDLIFKSFKGNNFPFGGMQIVMCGDFFQLPPVSKNGETSEFVTHSKIWQEMKPTICYLDEQYRQDDRSFLRVLNDIRNDSVDEMTVEYLSERIDKAPEGYVNPTKLFTHNKDVEAINNVHLQSLEGDLHEYFMTSRGSLGVMQSLRKSCLAPERLLLKKGAQVMFVKNNYEAGYVNGTIGEVIDFNENQAPIVRTFDGVEIAVGYESWEVKDPSAGSGQERILASITQLPLRLAWAITVHKSQGMSLDAAEIDLTRSFLPGMGYVALSRVRSLKGLTLKGMNQMALQVHPDVSEMDKEFRVKSDEALGQLLLLEKEKKQKLQDVHLLKFTSS